MSELLTNGRMVLEIEQLSFQNILHQVNTTFTSGQMVGIIGPNGAGKSTLMRLLAGIWKPSLGQVTLNGLPVRNLSTKERARHIAYLPQQLSADCPFTVHEFVEMGRYAHNVTWGTNTKQGQEIVQSSISEMGLEKYGNTRVSDLSGGERQRVGLARCLAQESSILLLDEPISNLDIFYQMDILERLRALSEQGYLVILSIHHLEFATRYCSNLLLLQKGKVYAQGTPEDVLSETAMADVFAVNASPYRDPFGDFVRFSYQPLREAD